jgi:hypothetical protein
MFFALGISVISIRFFIYFKTGDICIDKFNFIVVIIIIGIIVTAGAITSFTSGVGITNSCWQVPVAAYSFRTFLTEI